MKLPFYTKQDLKIMAIILPVIVVLINWLLFEQRYFTEWRILILATLVTGPIMTANWLLSGGIAVAVRNRFSKDKELPRLLGVMLLLIILLMVTTITIIFYGYDRYNFLGYTLNETRYQWTLLGGALINTLVTFVHVGMDSFEKWKSTLTETEQLKKEYLQSKVLGLKSQVNPHFLFNSLNSLSCLISENPKHAEKFLDEMCKVYRYLLRSEDSTLVPLQTELQFINSFYYLLKERYGEGIELDVTIPADIQHHFIPPLTLHILMENILHQNSICKDEPLKVEITALENEWLQIKNNLQPKETNVDESQQGGLNNIINKYRLLCRETVIVTNTPTHQVIQLPLIRQTEMSLV